VVAARQWTLAQIERIGTQRRPVFGFPVGSTQATSLGSATDVYRGPTAGTVWLYTRRGPVGRPPTSCDVRLVSVSDTLVVPPATLPCAWEVFGAVDQGLAVLEQGSAVGPFAVWTPPHWSKSSVTWPSWYPSTLGATGYPEGAGATIVLSRTPEPSQDGAGWPITVDDTATGASRTVVIPSSPGSLIDPLTAELSPDGRLLAYVTLRPATANALLGAPAAVQAHVVIVRLSTGTVVADRRLTLVIGGTGTESLYLQWSPDGAYVVAPSSRSTLVAVPAAATGTVRTIAIPKVTDPEGFVAGLLTVASTP
jgi:hypothetical protein